MCTVRVAFICSPDLSPAAVRGSWIRGGSTGIVEPGLVVARAAVVVVAAVLPAQPGDVEHQ